MIKLLIRALGHGPHAERLWDFWERQVRGDERWVVCLVGAEFRSKYLVEVAKEIEFGKVRGGEMLTAGIMSMSVSADGYSW